MTHDELLAKMSKPAHNLNANDARNVYLLALRAVVELHKPIQIATGGTWTPTETTQTFETHCIYCKHLNEYKIYPCPTIQAIEKELK